MRPSPLRCHAFSFVASAAYAYDNDLARGELAALATTARRRRAGTWRRCSIRPLPHLVSALEHDLVCTDKCGPVLLLMISHDIQTVFDKIWSKSKSMELKRVDQAEIERLYSFREAEQITGIKVATWRSWRTNRQIEVVQLGGSVKLRESYLRKLIESGISQPDEGPKAA